MAKPEQRYELRSNSAEEEEAEMKQPPKKIKQITKLDLLNAITAKFDQHKTCLLYTSRCV